MDDQRRAGADRVQVRRGARSGGDRAPGLGEARCGGVLGPGGVVELLLHEIVAITVDPNEPAALLADALERGLVELYLARHDRSAGLERGPMLEELLHDEVGVAKHLVDLRADAIVEDGSAQALRVTGVVEEALAVEPRAALRRVMVNPPAASAVDESLDRAGRPRATLERVAVPVDRGLCPLEHAGRQQWRHFDRNPIPIRLADVGPVPENPLDGRERPPRPLGRGDALRVQAVDDIVQGVTV